MLLTAGKGGRIKSGRFYGLEGKIMVYYPYSVRQPCAGQEILDCPERQTGEHVKKNTIGDYLITAEIVMIGLAETVHLAAVFLHWSFAKCVMLFGCMAGIAAVAGLVLLVFSLRRNLWKKPFSESRRVLDRFGPAEAVLYAVPLLLMVSQLIFICVGNTVYRGGDMTVETVGSFLAADSVYQVNPMTGQPYSAGLPRRLKILCLPTLYGCLCRYTGLEPAILVYRMAPVITLLSCYAAFSALAHCLFPMEKKRACFMAVAALLLWIGTYGEGMDGFGVLYAGWKGVVVRNAVLLPWLISLCLRKKWFSAALCILAEVCVTWTLYGCGACAAVTLGMAAAGWYCAKVSERAEAPVKGGREKG